MRATVLPVRLAQVEECALDGLALCLVHGDRPRDLCGDLESVDLDGGEVPSKLEVESLTAQDVRCARLLVHDVNAAPVKMRDAQHYVLDEVRLSVYRLLRRSHRNAVHGGARGCEHRRHLGRVRVGARSRFRTPAA